MTDLICVVLVHPVYGRRVCWSLFESNLLFCEGWIEA